MLNLFQIFCLLFVLFTMFFCFHCHREKPIGNTVCHRNLERRFGTIPDRNVCFAIRFIFTVHRFANDCDQIIRKFDIRAMSSESDITSLWRIYNLRGSEFCHTGKSQNHLMTMFSFERTGINDFIDHVQSNAAFRFCECEFCFFDPIRIHEFRCHRKRNVHFSFRRCIIFSTCTKFEDFLQNLFTGSGLIRHFAVPLFGEGEEILTQSFLSVNYFFRFFQF